MVFVNLSGAADTSEAAKTVEKLMAHALVIIGGGLAGLAIAALITRNRRNGRPGWQLGFLVGALLLLVVVAIEFNLSLYYSTINGWAAFWMALLLLPWGVLLGRALQRIATAQAAAAPAAEEEQPPATPAPGATLGPAPADETRRRVLIQLAGGSIVLALSASAAGWILNNRRRYLDTTEPVPLTDAQAPTAGQDLADLPPTVDALQPEPTAADPLLEPAPGTRQPVTPTEEFYRIDINTRPVVLDRDEWRLDVVGLFEQTGPLTLDDLMAYPAVTQAITISCISNPIGGDLIGTAYWSGVRLSDLLDDLGISPQASALRVEAADGFFEYVTMEDMRDPRTLLVYGMNGETLPVRNGFPLRIYIPNRYGMKQPKWITRIEAVSDWDEGYWVVRGWDREARPRIISIIDSIAVEAEENGVIPVGGIAYAGARGIQAVQLRVDDGLWQQADIIRPKLSELTWVLWRFDWTPPERNRYTLTVRAVDGAGNVQIEERSDPHPDGATGYHSRRIRL